MKTRRFLVQNFQQKINLIQKEEEILDYWDEYSIFNRSVEERDQSKRYVFYDGPPFATGTPHYGHILASTIKDVIPRYWTMKGYRVERVWGWDCHGIPIENMIEKELGLKGGKRGIEDLGIDTFNAACRAAILRFDREWEKVIRRIGRWVDFKNSYKTMDTSYMESVWWAFQTLWKKGLVYEGKRVILYCPRCATPLSNFEIAMDNSYKDLPGPSTTYKYKLKELKNTYLLAWSTTPWNKLATPALAVNPDIVYVQVRQGKERYILAETRLSMLHGSYTVEKRYKGKYLEQFTFELHYDFYPRKEGERAGVIIADSYVTDEEGTGVVTLAVYGEDDYRVMTAHNVQLVEHVDAEGKVKPEVTPWAGMFILKVNPLVNDDLRQRGLIYHDEERVHSVPVCYRCETRLYQAPVPAWFINIQKLKPDLIKYNEYINWYPSHLKYGRFGKGLETAPDWNISRSRYWGTPMPVWKAQQQQADGAQQHMRIIGSLEELKHWAVDPKNVERLTDIHREFLDDIEVWVDDDRTIKGRRIPEVFDCWVESGSMPYASIHYPFENKEVFEKTHPAQFIAEYIAQTRAWFYTLHVMSVGLFGKHTFEHAVTTGNILAEDGQKMSKSKKNYPDPSLLFQKYGVDALRFYLMASPVMKAENINFSEKGVAEVYQRVITLLWNTFCFYKLYATNDTISCSSLSHDLDRWIVSKTHRLIRDVTQSLDAYNTPLACRCIASFVDDLSTWYLRRSRERFKNNPSSMAVFGWVLYQVAHVIAPIIPFLAELMYQHLPHSKDSVHLENWPSFDEAMIHDELEEKVDLSRSIVEALHSIRKKHELPIKQPLAAWSFKGINKDIFSDVPDIFQSIHEEVHVYQYDPSLSERSAESAVIVHKIYGQISVCLDITLTPQLKEQRRVRELIRSIQVLRKEHNLSPRDVIVLTLPKEYQTLSKSHLDQITHDTVASRVVWGDSLKISIG
ncbi:MAG: isoleucine--tRNA ligase [Patescibacteria group bacterium]|nr:isoleucine--tRNA ligase [Patescibacteria group bacterium]